LKKFQVGDLVLLYDRKFLQLLGKFHMHWLGPYVIQEMKEAWDAQLETLNGVAMKGRVKYSWLKIY
jgi:hypothetical protein